MSSLYWSQTTQRVLIVDDNANNTFCLKFAMQGWNVDVSVAESGQQALDYLSRQKFDYVLMDMRMPVMSGSEVIGKIRANSDICDVVIIAATGDVMAGAREKCLAAGADEYIGKPINLDELWQKMAALSGAPIAD